MAADGWGEAPPLIDQLLAPVEVRRAPARALDPARPPPPAAPSSARDFDFFQAVSILERIHKKEAPRAMVSVGEGGDPRREAVRFVSNERLSFASTDIESLRLVDGRPIMKVNFLGVAGAHGPLPGPFAEIVAQRAASGDTAMRDFLDVFNHRVVSLAYRIRKRHRIGLGVASPVEDDASRYLRALLGLGTAHLQDRLGHVEDRALLFYAGLFAREARSMAGLATLLRCHLDVPVEGTPLVGGFYPIEPSHRTVIGPSGRNRRLGRDAVLGARYWDAEAAFELTIGPLDARDYQRFLPVDGGDRLGPLCELVRLYAGPTLELRVRLVLNPAAALERAARPRLGAGGARRPPPRRSPSGAALPAPPPIVEGKTQTLAERPRLGYTAWVGAAWLEREVVLEGSALPAPSRK